MHWRCPALFCMVYESFVATLVYVASSTVIEQPIPLTAVIVVWPKRERCESQDWAVMRESMDTTSRKKREKKRPRHTHAPLRCRDRESGCSSMTNGWLRCFELSVTTKAPRGRARLTGHVPTLTVDPARWIGLGSRSLRGRGATACRHCRLRGAIILACGFWGAFSKVSLQTLSSLFCNFTHLPTSLSHRGNISSV